MTYCDYKGMRQRDAEESRLRKSMKTNSALKNEAKYSVGLLTQRPVLGVLLVLVVFLLLVAILG